MQLSQITHSEQLDNTAKVECVCLSCFSCSWDKTSWPKRLKGEVGFVAHSLRLQSIMQGSHSTGHTRGLHPQSRSRDWQTCVLGSLSLLYVVQDSSPRKGYTQPSYFKKLIINIFLKLTMTVWIPQDLAIPLLDLNTCLKDMNRNVHKQTIHNSWQLQK